MYRGQDLSWRDSEDRPTSNAEICCAEGIRAIPAPNSCAIEIPVRGTNKRGFGINANAGQGSQSASRGDLKDRATLITVDAVITSTAPSCPIEVSVGRLNQRCKWGLAIRATGLGAEAIQGGQCARRRHSEHLPAAVNPAELRRPVEIAVGALN